MSDPNFPPQQYPNPSQSQRAQYDQPRQQVYQQPQYTQPQANPYATGQQYAQTPQYGQPQYQQPQYAQYQYGQQPYVNPQPADTGSFGWAVLGFFFPIVGLILFLVWKSEKPVSAKQAGMGALASVISTVVLWILLIVFAAMIGSAVTY
jgi:hypothetical protein